MSNTRYIFLVPTAVRHPSNFKCLAISRSDGFCRSFTGKIYILFPKSASSLYVFLILFSGEEQEDFWMKAVTIDPLYNVLWSYNSERALMKSYLNTIAEFSERRDSDNASASNSSSPSSVPSGIPTIPNVSLPSTIISPELSLPMSSGCLVSRNQASLNLLSCLDTLNQIPEVNLTVIEEDSNKAANQKNYTKEDFCVVNR